MSNTQALFQHEAPEVKPSLLRPLRCPACGACDVPVVGPGVGQHAYRANCGHCGRYLQWLKKQLVEKESRPVSVNRCLLVGTIGKYGVEVRYNTNGVPCASFMLICSEQSQDGKTHDLYIPCECWGKRAEQASELEAGQLALFEGKLGKRKKGEQWELVIIGFDLTPIGTATAAAARN